jgi:hypothetical protein
MTEQTTPEQIAIRVYNDSILANCLNCGEPNCLKGLKFIDSQPILPHCYQGGSGRERFCDLTHIVAIENSESRAAYRRGENDPIRIAINNLDLLLIEARKK